MEKKNIIIGAIVLAVIVVGVFMILRNPSETELDLEYNQYIFTENDLDTSPSLYSPPAPTPDCEIQGIITDVKFVEAHDHPCMAEGENTCPTDTPLNFPDQYFIRMYVTYVNSVEGTGEGAQLTCEEIIPTGEYKNFHILGTDITEELKVKKTINGLMTVPAQVMRINSYTLKDIYPN